VLRALVTGFAVVGPVVLCEVELLDGNGCFVTGAIGTWSELVGWARAQQTAYIASQRIPVADLSALGVPSDHGN
jgi:hypothetical protein